MKTQVDQLCVCVCDKEEHIDDWLGLKWEELGVKSSGFVFNLSPLFINYSEAATVKPSLPNSLKPKPLNV